MLYEYHCAVCDNTWELEQRIVDPPITTCPSCKCATARRLITGGCGFVLKGGGWHSDLYSSTTNVQLPAQE